MDTIKSYLDNMFAGLPKTARVNDLKNNILSNMEEKYNELKSQGKSENEAIGIVISEFGNIDELVSELGIRKDDTDNSQPLVTGEEVEAYLSMKKKMSLQIGFGVFLCILAPAVFLLITGLLDHGMIHVNFNSDSNGIPGLIVLFILVSIGVAIFIYSGMNFERFKYMEDGVLLPSAIENDLKQRYDRYTPKFYFYLTIGICLIILSPISIFVTSLIDDDFSIFGVVILLVIVAISVFLFIVTGATREGIEHLLKIGDYVPKKKKENKVIGAVASIIWPLATLIFLFCGFVFHNWYIIWIVFPITGILFGMFSAAYSILTQKNE